MNHSGSGYLPASDDIQSGSRLSQNDPREAENRQHLSQAVHPIHFVTFFLGNPANPVLVVAGDAGLQYTIQEMTLAAELELNIVVLLWNNDALQQIRDDMDNAGISRIGVAQKNPDFIALAKANHWTAWKVENLSELGADLIRGFDTTGPALIQLDESLVI